MSDTVSRGALQAASVPRHNIDTYEMPEWGQAEDGSRVQLVKDDELIQDYAEWAADACSHSAQFTGKTINAIGAVVFKRYCKTCGLATTQSLPHRTVENTNIEPIDNLKREKLVDKYARARRHLLDAMANRCADRSQPQRRGSYAEYLNSPAWALLRNKVVERCGDVCEGCRSAPVDDVHHLTYQHIYQEFAFELVGLCRSCHTRWHDTTGEGTGE